MKVTELREVRSERFIHYPGNGTPTSEIERLRKARTNEKVEERLIFVVRTQISVGSSEHGRDVGMYQSPKGSLHERACT